LMSSSPGGDRDMRFSDMASFCVWCVGEEKWTSGRSDPPKVGPSLAFLQAYKVRNKAQQHHD